MAKVFSLLAGREIWIADDELARRKARLEKRPAPAVPGDASDSAPAVQQLAARVGRLEEAINAASARPSLPAAAEAPAPSLKASAPADTPAQGETRLRVVRGDDGLIRSINGDGRQFDVQRDELRRLSGMVVKPAKMGD